MLIAPSTLALTMATLETIVPWTEVIFAVVACGKPAVHTVKYPSGPGGTAVMLNE
jgi:hypothetical protein